MIDIDGSDGGGGVLRTALGLAIATGTPVRVDDVRGDRPDPGLEPQHVACIEAARAVADGDATGAEPDSETVTFEPGSLADGTTRTAAVDVGTAGSATLVASTVLPAALVTEGTVRIRIDGGTDVAWSPPADYLGGVTLPALRAHGLAAALDVPRRGFYPAGGGRLRLTLGPSTPEPLALAEPPGTDAAGSQRVARVDVSAVASDDLLGADVADRMAREAATRLGERGVPVGNRAARYVGTESTGAIVTLRAAGAVGVGDGDGKGDEGGDAAARSREQAPLPIAGFSALGEAGVPSEAIAGRAVSGFDRWRASPGVVDARLADQLVPWLALVGGAVRIPSLTDHVASAVAVARAFDRPIAVDDRGDDDCDGRDGGDGGVVLRATGGLDE